MIQKVAVLYFHNYIKDIIKHSTLHIIVIPKLMSAYIEAYMERVCCPAN